MLIFWSNYEKGVFEKVLPAAGALFSKQNDSENGWIIKIFKKIKTSKFHFSFATGPSPIGVLQLENGAFEDLSISENFQLRMKKIQVRQRENQLSDVRNLEGFSLIFTRNS